MSMYKILFASPCLGRLWYGVQVVHVCNWRFCSVLCTYDNLGFGGCDEGAGDHGRLRQGDGGTGAALQGCQGSRQEGSPGTLQTIQYLQFFSGSPGTVPTMQYLQFFSVVAGEVALGFNRDDKT